MKRALIALMVGLGAVAVGPDPRFRRERMQACQRPSRGTAGAGPGFTAVGRLTGGVQGTDNFTLLSTSETDLSTPSLVSFIGTSVFTTKSGTIRLAVAGAFDTATGKFSDLLTITGGTGAWEGASGQLHLFGTFNLESRTGESDYRGEVCPR